MSSYLERSLTGVAFDPSLTAGKMVFIAGPRQAGKTSLARRWLDGHGCPELYFNWDDAGFRRLWVKTPSALV